MLSVGQQFPEFHLKANVSNEIRNAFIEVNNKQYQDKWLVVFFWPKDFTFVCPTEIAEFGKLNQDFLDRDAQILGVSIDSEFVHLAWRQHKQELTNIPFPLVSDLKRELTTQLGVLDPTEGVAQRVTYIVDPSGIIRFVMATDMKVGRNVREILRVLDALQTDELCPCNWQKGGATINVAAAAAPEKAK